MQAALLSLPALVRTTIADVPADTPYLSADLELVEKWRSRLEEIDGVKLGIAWQGNPAWVGDRYRSIPLKHFQVLAELPGVRLISLQKGSGAEQVVTALNHFQIVDLGLQIDASSGPFMDTAAIMQALDLVITCDTSIAHLAGALGVEVWLALCYAPDWRWLIGRDDSPWYPTMRLFRQPRPGDWESVFSSIVHALQKRLLSSQGQLRRRQVLRALKPVAERSVRNRERCRFASEGDENATNQRSINLTAPINRLGYGVVGANILKGLVRKNVSVAYWPIGRIDAQPGDQAVIEEAIQHQATFDGDAPSLRIAHQDQLAQHVGFPRIAFPLFELNRFSEKELNHLRNQDAIFVASRWAKEVIETNDAFPDLEHVHVIPLGVDRTIFCEPLPAEATNGGPKPTIFLSVGKWERRKGHDMLLDAFNTAFSTEDNVELWMLAYNPVITADPGQAAEKNQAWEEQLYRSSLLGAKIKFLPRFTTHREVASVMQQVDCGVFLSRAEGWNLPALEMMSCGKQVIATNYSAHTEYCNASNAQLIEIDTLEDAHDGRWFFGHGQWAALGDEELDQAVASMRQVHAQKQGGASLLNHAGIETAKRFSWDNTAAQILKALGY